MTELNLLQAELAAAHTLILRALTTNNAALMAALVDEAESILCGIELELFFNERCQLSEVAELFAKGIRDAAKTT